MSAEHESGEGTGATERSMPLGESEPVTAATEPAFPGESASPGEPPAPAPFERAPVTESAPGLGSSSALGSDPAAGGDVATGSAAAGGLRRHQHEPAPNMLPGRARRTLGAERFLVRLIATGGVIGIGVAIAAIMASSNAQGWIIGLVVSIVSVILSAILWSSRQL
jgi:hypothetical protein